jgi:hypothetical protein
MCDLVGVKITILLLSNYVIMSISKHASLVVYLYVLYGVCIQF